MISGVGSFEYMHRTGHSRKIAVLTLANFFATTFTHSQWHISPLFVLITSFPSVGHRPSPYWFDWTKYICAVSLSLSPPSFPSILLFYFSEPPRFCGLSFFVNRKFEFKYYYTVALSSGAKKKKRNAVIARSFFFFFASGLCLSITCLHYLYFHLSFFEYRKKLFCPGFHIWLDCCH